MAFGSISNASLTQQTLRLFKASQVQIGDLQQQLASGKKSVDISAYGDTTMRRLLDLRGDQQRFESYIEVIDSVRPRLEVQQQSLDEIQNGIDDVRGLINQTQTFTAAQDIGAANQILNKLRDAQFYLNQRVDNRYIFAGSRYTTEPVADLTALPVPPTEPFPFVAVTAPALPRYDSQFASSPQAAAWDVEDVQIDDEITVSYSVPSTDDGFQQYILGLRWAYAATQDPTNYQTYMTRAATLLDAARVDIRGIEATTAANLSLFDRTRTLHQTTVNDMINAQEKIEGADTAEVSVRLTNLTAQLQASFAATGQITKLSLLSFL